jgi:hypothetical protein
MNSAGDDELQGGQGTGNTANLFSIEQLARIVPFPMYGLIQTPDDLTLHGIGYSTADLGWTHPASPSLPTPSQFIWQVVLTYGYPPRHQNKRPRLELSTTSLAGIPMPVPPIEELVQASATHYPSEDAVPLLDSQPASFLIERFATMNGQALAAVTHTPDPPQLMLHPKDAIGRQMHKASDTSADRVAPVDAWSITTPDWSFTLRNAQMWVEGQAYGWTQAAIFQVLHQLAPINDKADVLVRYHQEIVAWERFIRSS